MNKLTTLSVAVTAAFSASHAFAEKQVDEVLLVTATRTEQPLDATLSSASVLSELDIQRSQAQDLPELLGRLVGLDADNSGGRGSNSAIRLRGTESDHVLVLIDGVRSASASQGTTAIQHLPVNQIERIEVVRGPRSSLYGSEAIGGVVQVFTKKGSQELRPYVDLSYGSHETVISQAGIRGSLGNTLFSLNGSHEESDGIDRTYNNAGADTDKDGYRESAVSANLQHTFDNGTELALNYLRSEGNTELDGANSSTDFVNESRDISISVPVNDAITVKGQLAQYRDENVSFGFSPSTFETNRDAASLQLDYALSEAHLISVGYDYYIDEVSSTSNFVESERDNKSWFVQYQGDYDRWHLQAGLRRDDNEAFGNHDTGNIALGFDINEDTLISLSYGTAFKSPTFNDLYFPFTDFGCFFGICFTYEGNPDLKPEQSESIELMVRGKTGSVGWFASIYQTNVDDLITLSSDFSTVDNVDNAEILGGEAGATFELLGWRTAASLAYTDPRNESDDSLLLRRSRASANVDISRRFGKLDLSFLWQVQSYRYDRDNDNDGKNDRLAGFGTLDIRARYQINDELSLALKVNNLFDQDYTLNYPFETEGTTAAISVRYEL